MALSASTPVRAILTAPSGNNHSVTITGVQAHDTVFYAWLDRSGGNSLDSMTDDEGGSYTARLDLANGMTCYVREDVAAPSDGSLVMTGHAVNSGNSQVVGGYIRSDAGGSTYATFDAAAAVAGGTGTAVDSADVTATAAGLLLAILGTGNTQGSTPTIDTSNASLSAETVAPAGGAGVRFFAVSAVNASAGSRGFNNTATSRITLLSSSSWSIRPLHFKESGGTAPPAIGDVDEDNTVALEQANVEIDGADFNSATVFIEQDSQRHSCSIDSQDADTIVFDMPLVSGECSKHGDAFVVVVNTDAQEDSLAITITPESGSDYVDVASIAGAVPKITAIPDIEIGDQIQWRDVTGSGVFDETDVIVYDDTSLAWADGVEQFYVRVWDHDTFEWSDWVVQTIDAAAPEDSTPAAFTFTDQNDVSLSSVIESNEVEVEDINVEVAVTVTTGEYSKNGGAYTSAAGVANLGDTFRVRHTSSGSYSTPTSTTLTIGGVSDTFTSTTVAPPSPIESAAGRKRDARNRGFMPRIWGGRS